MILTDLNDYPTINVTFRNSEWSYEEIRQSLNALVDCMVLVAANGHKFEIFIQGNTAVTVPPPLTCYTQIIGMLVKNRELLRNNLLCTAIFTPTPDLDTMIGYVLSIYKPTRPVEKFEDFNQAKEWIFQHRRDAAAISS